MRLNTLLLLLFILNTCYSQKDLKINGLSFVAPRKPISELAMKEVQSVNANWIAVIPYGFSPNNKPELRFHNDTSGMWGETPRGVQACIDSAHSKGIKVMIKPQVWIRGGWTGGMDYPTNEEWVQWEQAYEKYILTFAEVAQRAKADMFCIGTEFKTSTTKREAFWRSLIKKVRTIYIGKLTYASNWDEYMLVPFWDALDVAGIDAYFPLVQKETPSVSELKTAWKPLVETLKKFQQRIKKPVVFTEFGYLDTDGCAYNSWEIEKRLKDVNINQQGQANGIEALLTVFSKEHWWHGGFIWKWYPESRKRDKDYSPQGKIAEKVLKEMYSKK